MRLARLVAMGAAVLAMTAFSPGPVSAYDWSYYDVYNQNLPHEFEETACWCVDAVVKTALYYMPYSTIPNQTSLDSYMKPKNLIDWQNWSGGITCNQAWQHHSGYPATSYPNDSRGAAWALANNTVTGHEYVDYEDANQTDQDWNIVENLRVTGDPVPATVAKGSHEVLVVGYSTLVDPFVSAYAGGTNTLYGLYIWDPWYGAFPGHESWFSTWNGGTGYYPNYFLTKSDWDTSIFRPDKNEGDTTTPVRTDGTQTATKGSPYYLKYVAVMEAESNTQNPDNNNSEELGRYTYFNQQPGYDEASTSATASTPDVIPTQATIASAVDEGLRDNHLLGSPQVPTLDGAYSVGNIVHVDSMDPETPSYELVELTESGRTVAIALVNDAASGYWFGALDAVHSGFRLPGAADLAAQVSAAGLHGNARVEWGATVEGATRFAPFVIGTDAHGNAAIAGAQPGTPLFQFQ